MTPKRRLGRGLEALLSKPVAESAAVTGKVSAGGLRELPVELLQRGQYQPRVDIRQDTLEDLASSIRAQGVVQPIVVRPIGKEGGTQRYEIVAGERRWRAAQMAGLADIPAVVKDIPDDAAIAMALIENIQREDLNPLEEARALDRLIREFDLTHAEAAEAVGRAMRGRFSASATRCNSLMRPGRWSKRACRFVRPSAWSNICSTIRAARSRSNRRKPGMRIFGALKSRCLKNWAPRSASITRRRARASLLSATTASTSSTVSSNTSNKHKPRKKQALRGKNDPLVWLPCRGADTIMRELITGSI